MDKNKRLCPTQAEREDFALQLEAAKRSFEQGYLATARAELNGAVMVTEITEKRVRLVSHRIAGGDYISGARDALAAVAAYAANPSPH